MRMNAKSPMQSYWSYSVAIRQEIQRFESVHSSIYAIYDLIEAIPDPLIQQQIREHVVCIE
ncbi:centaurin-gamma-1A, partial [Biomphalaria pfeifferi]